MTSWSRAVHLADGVPPSSDPLHRGTWEALPVALSATGISVPILEGVPDAAGSGFDEMVAEAAVVVPAGLFRWRYAG